MKEELATITNVVKVLEACDAEIPWQGEATKQQICIQAQNARAAIDQAEKELVENALLSRKKRCTIPVQKQEAKEEQARLQSLLDFVEHNLATQSDKQIVVSKQSVLDRLNKAVSHEIHARFVPSEDADISHKKSMETLES